MALTRPRAEQIYNLDYKQATRVVTITNVTLSGGAPNNVDGVNLTIGDRVLVTGQVTASQNGIYDVYTLGTGSNGTWVRTSDANATGEIEAGMIIMVTEGQIYADTQWKLITDNPIVIGTTGLVFTQNYLANSISAGSSNVVVAGNANVTVSSSGVANVLTVSPTGVYVSGITSTSGNIYAGNISVSGNITGNISFDQGVSAVGNIIGGNLITGGYVTAVGNIYGNYIYGNGSTLTGVSNYANANVTAYAESGWAGNIIPAGNAVYSLGNATNTWYELWLSGNSLQIGGGNLSVNGGNLLFNGNVITTQQGTSGNISANNISLAGNAVASYFVGDGSYLSNINAGNITGAYGNANVYQFLQSGNSVSISTTGNISTAGNILASRISVSGNIYGNNLIANNSVNWSNNGATAVYQLYNASSGSLDTIFV